jgi:hypothetical protein
VRYHRCQRTRRMIGAALLATVSVLALLSAPAVAAASTNYTWSGAAAPSTANWSNGTNWEGSAPQENEMVGTLTFPALTIPACAVEPPTATCYQSKNDVSGLNVNALSIDFSAPYVIRGDPITLGSGGITGSTSPSTFGGTSIDLPITLSAPQTWSFEDNNYNGQLTLNSNVSGASDALSLDMSNLTIVPTIGGNVEVGPLTIAGEVGLVSGFSEGGRTTPSLNGSDGNPVSFGEGASLNALSNATTGPLTFGNHFGLNVGSVFNGPAHHGAAMLTINSGVTLNSSDYFNTFINMSGTTAGTDYSQLDATGTVSLGGAELYLGDGLSEGSGLCETLTPGDVDTLVTTTGSLTGTFNGVPDGTTIALFGCEGTAPTVRINYTVHTVTATVLTAGSGGASKIPTTTALHLSNPSPAVGEAVTYTATVTPETPGEAEPSGSVEFLDEGQSIGTCSAQPLIQGTSSSTATCTLSYPTAGAHNISASYAGDASYEGSASTAQTVTVQSPPSNTLPPTIMGSAQLGQTLTCSPGAWSGTLPPTFNYQWQRDGSDLAGATTSTYVVQTADQGHTLTCKVTATNGAGQASAVSAGLAIPAASGGGELPNTVLGSHPPAKLTTKSAKAKVKFKFSSSTAGATFKCKLDKETFKPCQSPKSYKVKPGKHVFAVEAIDAAGADATPTIFRFRVRRR